MFWMKFIFWASLFILFYCFIGYTMLLWILVQVKKNFFSQKITGENEIIDPEVTLIVAAYNEKDFIEQKIVNSLSLNYPPGKIKHLFITDGSDDGTNDIVARYPQLILLHQPERKGKSAALNRAMQIVTTPIVVFTDANTLLNKNAIKYMAKHYADSSVGGVSGEKQIEINSNKNTSGIGEGFYWKYESLLKKLESVFHSLVGSAGELFSIRTSLFKTIPENIILDDFYMALKINKQGYKVAYETKAIAAETPSASLADEKRRKVRIASGAYQLAFKFIGMLNVFKYPLFTFQFISHKILRWFLAPVCILITLILGFMLFNAGRLYQYLFYAQIIFYVFALIGWFLQKKKIVVPLFYFPFYFLFMNYCNVMGWFSYFSGNYNVLWDKSQRQIQSSPSIPD
ncbi:MAG: glycosyltransferase family 2 protein [Sphingobacteriales bacterium]